MKCFGKSSRFASVTIRGPGFGHAAAAGSTSASGFPITYMVSTTIAAWFSATGSPPVERSAASAISGVRRSVSDNRAPDVAASLTWYAWRRSRWPGGIAPARTRSGRSSLQSYRTVSPVGANRMPCRACKPAWASGRVRSHASNCSPAYDATNPGSGTFPTRSPVTTGNPGVAASSASTFSHEPIGFAGSGTESPTVAMSLPSATEALPRAKRSTR